MGFNDTTIYTTWHSK